MRAIVGRFGQTPGSPACAGKHGQRTRACRGRLEGLLQAEEAMAAAAAARALQSAAAPVPEPV
eukprot:5302782-Lingulodinium_polyedra.AAC.1